MREKTLKQEIASLQAGKGLLEQEKQSSEESRKEEHALRLAREFTGLDGCFLGKNGAHGGLASILVGMSNDAKALGGHGVAVAALDRMESGRTINAGWLQQFIRLHPKKTLHEALKKGLQQLSDSQLPLFGPLCSAVSQMRSSTEIASFEGDALTVLPDDAGEEVRVPELAPDFIGIEVEWEEDSSEQVREDDQNNQELVGKERRLLHLSRKPTKANQASCRVRRKFEPSLCNRVFVAKDSYFIHLLHLLVLEEDEVVKFPMYAMISSILRKFGDVHNTDKVKLLEKELSDAVNALNLRVHSPLVQPFRQQEEEWKRRLHQYNLDFHASLSLEANIDEEMGKLKGENSQLGRRKKIVISMWFLEKFDMLAPVESQIKVRTERFIAAINLLKKRTREAEFYSRQATVLQNILVDNQISLPILDDLDLEDKARERAAAEEYLVRLNDQDWEILDLRDKLGHCLHMLRSLE
ncbi:OLC1v1016104C1 [Oldenlandia corymbosa var. corymbosa]|uniref:OLC1v1016104C1 n=1 Tax=Oldenlandia corymbosa var. corymbosa TaxID=529605 RepID=A0AAV1E4S6_OLDCO|nr:OLC1v1016104C1 [Oldenlandia corymbosa var. corymbosa]